ncbi:MAG: OmpA family protein [Treponema sp.]|nr:OmpA family protein [Treponema sp.]
MSNESESSGIAGEFSLSISDMMSALCAIFVLLCIGSILQLKQISEKLKDVSEHYVNTRYTLYEDLSKEFSTDLEKWNAEIDRENLSIRFKDPDVLFLMNEAILQDSYKKILGDFFPRLLKVVDRYEDLIEEIRIEGHSSEAVQSISSGLISDREDYEEGMELSQGRTRSVLSYCLNDTSYPENRGWIRSKIVAIGYSKSHPVRNEAGEIDWNASRRVEFRIKLNSDNEILRNFSKAAQTGVD